jgi:Domain of unknown function (DUF4124)
MKSHIHILTVVIFALSCPASGGEIYKWVDKDGNVHFGDQPGKADAQQIDVPKFKTDPVLEQREQTRQESEKKEQADNADKTNEEAEAKKKEEQRKKNCVTARERVEQLQTVRRLFRIDASGERHDLSDEERATALQKAQEDVKTWCD